MKYLNFISCNWLQVFFGSILLQYIVCECEFPDNKFPDGRIIYKSPSDVNKTSAEEFYILEFECSIGFQLIGRRDVQCVDNEWTSEIPFCALLECSKPPEIGNATYEVTAGVSKLPVVGSYAEYTCNKGYELADKNVSALHCDLNTNTKNGEWTGEIPFCNEINSCPDPGVSKFGRREGQCCISGTSLLFECNEGYELVGEDTIHCLPFGNWSSLRPLCKPFEEHCELPPSIPHGIVVGDKAGDYFVPYEDAVIECEPGYRYDGFELVLCEEGGIWESEFGECIEAFCDPPPPLTNGIILELQSTNLTMFPYNFELTYVCDKNYRLIGDSWRVCEESGWSGKTPTCKVTKCPDPGRPEHGNRMASNFTVGSTVRFFCFDGYDLLGSFERECLQNGQWSGDLARCNLPTNYCPNPGIPIRGSKNSTNYALGSKIEFRCREEYIRIGSRVRECLKDHTWSGIETKCLGKYDFDDEANIGKKINDLISQKVEEQRKNAEKYHQLKSQGRLRGRMLDLNYPGITVLYFMFDVSGSVGEGNFNKSIQFAKAIVKKVGISETRVRAGALTFSSQVKVNFYPMQLNTTQDVLAALDRIKYTGGGTATSSALNYFRKKMLPVVERWLGSTKSIIFLLTDGRANMGGNPLKEAQVLKNEGVEIYCFGITGSTRKESLYSIASESKNEKYPHVYIFRDYPSLSWLVKKMTNETIDYSQCGLGLENVGKVGRRMKVKGVQKNIEPWPWMAALFMENGEEIKPKHEFHCGGSVIHQNFILTAAHCLYEYEDYDADPVQRDEKSIIIKLGLTDKSNESYVQEFEVKEMFIHPKYEEGNSFDYDIALLQLEKPADYNAYVRPICLPPEDVPVGSRLYRPSAPAWAIGWGKDVKVSKNVKTTEHLKEIYLPIQSKETCIESIRNNNWDISDFTDRMFCAGDGTGVNDTCTGDSGGPIMQSQRNDEGYVYWTQVGIVSFGYDCGLENTYGYYTHLQKFASWVEETIEKALNSTGV